MTNAWGVLGTRTKPRRMAGNTGEGLMSAKQFREYAAEHLGWVETAKSEHERQILQRMAQAWLEVAALWEDPASIGSGLVQPTSE
jgi:hypothetical protein